MFRWNPGKDLIAVAVSWLLVVGALYTATVIVGTTVWGGMAYFLLAALGFAEILLVMFVLVWLARRYYNKHFTQAAQAIESGVG